MGKKRFRRRRYHFTDKSIAVDTVISFVLGIIALTIEISGVAASVISKGHVSEIYGVLYVCAFICGISGLIYARFGLKAQEGGGASKRWSHVVNIIAVIVPLVMIISGLIK